MKVKSIIAVWWGLVGLAGAVACRAQPPSTVLVVGNANSPQSAALVSYYMEKRKIPAQNRLLLDWKPEEEAAECTMEEYQRDIASPVYAKINTLSHIDYIVLCRNLPCKIKETMGSVDSALAGKSTTKKKNPYFNKRIPFSSQVEKIYLVTRLDGWSWEDARALVDRSLAAKPDGVFYFDSDPDRGKSRGYGWYNERIVLAFRALSQAGVLSELENTTTFAAPSQPLGGYVSWGSNDRHFKKDAYYGLRFAPGAIAETAVSGSGIHLRAPGRGQSQIAVLIRSGVTGAKCYVWEPKLDAIADPPLLMTAYAYLGRNLAESFYIASRYVGWKDVVIGDPLCCPYRRAAAAR